MIEYVCINHFNIIDRHQCIMNYFKDELINVNKKFFCKVNLVFTALGKYC